MVLEKSGRRGWWGRLGWEMQIEKIKYLHKLISDTVCMWQVWFSLNLQGLNTLSATVSFWNWLHDINRLFLSSTGDHIHDLLPSLIPGVRNSPSWPPSFLLLVPLEQNISCWNPSGFCSLYIGKQFCFQSLAGKFLLLWGPVKKKKKDSVSQSYFHDPLHNPLNISQQEFCWELVRCSILRRHTLGISKNSKVLKDRIPSFKNLTDLLRRQDQYH